MITIDMEMPKSCFECPMYDNYNYNCTLYSFGIPARHNRDGSTRPEWCELEELSRCEDAVSRQAVIDAMNEVYCHIEMIKKRPVNKTEQAVYLDMIGAVKSVPSAEPEHKLDEWCEGCKEYDKERHCCPRFNRVIRTALSEAEPERKTGTWQKCGKDCRGYSDTYECSECGCLVQYAYYVTAIDYDFCPHCGARMEE